MTTGLTTGPSARLIASFRAKHGTGWSQRRRREGARTERPDRGPPGQVLGDCDQICSQPDRGRVGEVKQVCDPFPGWKTVPEW